MLYRIYQLFIQETIPSVKASHILQPAKKDFSETKPYVIPVGTIMHSISSDVDISIRLLAANSSYLWKICLANVKNKSSLEEALKFSSLYPALCYKSESIPLWGDPDELFSYKYDSIIIGYDQIQRKIFLENYQKN